MVRTNSRLLRRQFILPSARLGERFFFFFCFFKIGLLAKSFLRHQRKQNNRSQFMAYSYNNITTTAQ